MNFLPASFRTPLVKRSFVVCCLALSATAFMYFVKAKQEREHDAPILFAKQALSLLVAGDEKVIPMIDWNHFSLSNTWSGATKVSALYGAHPNLNSKATFCRRYITSFAADFKKRGYSQDSFTNWCIDNTFYPGNRTGPNIFMVWADQEPHNPRTVRQPRMVGVMVLRRDGKLRISEIWFSKGLWP